MPRSKTRSYESIANFLKTQDNTVAKSEMENLMIAVGWDDVISRPTIYRLLSDKVQAAGFGITELPLGSGRWTYSAKVLDEFNQRGFELYGQMPVSKGNTDLMQSVKAATKDLEAILATRNNLGANLDEIDDLILRSVRALRAEYKSDPRLTTNLKTAAEHGITTDIVLGALSGEAPITVKRIAALVYALHGKDE